MTRLSSFNDSTSKRVLGPVERITVIKFGVYDSGTAVAMVEAVDESR